MLSPVAQSSKSIRPRRPTSSTIVWQSCSCLYLAPGVCLKVQNEADGRMTWSLVGGNFTYKLMSQWFDLFVAVPGYLFQERILGRACFAAETRISCPLP